MGGAAEVGGRTGAEWLICDVLGAGATTGALVGVGGTAVLCVTDGTTVVAGDDGTAELVGAEVDTGVRTVAG